MKTYCHRRPELISSSLLQPAIALTGLLSSADASALTSGANNLLGYRVCLINAATFPDTEKLDSLKQLQIAQGPNWADIEIYKHNGIYPKSAPTFEALFDMLAARRFECVPLGADEVMYTWRDKKSKFPLLAVEPDLLIYYDYPIYLHVSKQFPELAQRVAQRQCEKPQGFIQ